MNFIRENPCHSWLKTIFPSKTIKALEGNSATYPQMAKLHLSQISYLTSQI